MSDIEEQLRRFVIDNFLFGRDGDGLQNGDSLLEQGIVDSMGVMELVAFLEEKYKITIQDHELIPENLDSINKLEKFLERKLQYPA